MRQWEARAASRQRFEIDRFHQVIVKTRLLRPAKVLDLAVAGQCYELDKILPLQRAHASPRRGAVGAR
jgi:hypothetical protein